jgi:hypothetical protein
MIELKELLKQELLVKVFKKEMQKELKDCKKHIEWCLADLELVGCYLKDFEKGVIDFPSILNNRVVFLNWTYGEKTINYWHEITEEIEAKREIETLDKV